MSPGDVAAFASLFDKGGVVAVLVAAVLALAWMARWLLNLLLAAYKDAAKGMREERDAWRTIALGGLSTAERGVAVAEQQVGLRS